MAIVTPSMVTLYGSFERKCYSIKKTIILPNNLQRKNHLKHKKLKYVCIVHKIWSGLLANLDGMDVLEILGHIELNDDLVALVVFDYIEVLKGIFLGL